jgi:hypothetical protein
MGPADFKELTGVFLLDGRCAPPEPPDRGEHDLIAAPGGGEIVTSPVVPRDGHGKF